MRPRLALICSLTCCLLCCPISNLWAHNSQANQYYIKTLSVEDGLSQSMVYSILQDSKGFMWFGTQDGLNRYDGQFFKIFKSDSQSSRAIGDNAHFSAYEHIDGKIWFGCSDGIYIYDPLQESFSKFEEKSSSGISIDGTTRQIICDQDGCIWIAVDGLGLFSYDTSLRHYPIAGIKSIKDICIDSSHRIWMVGYDSAIACLDEGQIHYYPFTEANCVLPLNSSTLLIGTVSQGVQQYDIARHSSSSLIDKDSEGNPLFVRRIIKSQDGNFWLGTESGVYSYDYSSSTLHALKHNYNDPYSLSDNAIHSLYQDRNGAIWAGSYFGGVNYIEPQSSVFEKYYPIFGSNSISGKSISEFCEDEQGRIWIGTEDAGLNLYSPLNGKFSSGFIPATNIHALLNTQQELWVGTFSDGLYIISTKTGRIIKHLKAGEQGLGSNNIYSLLYAPNGNIWLGSSSGLQIYHQKEKIFKNVLASELNTQVNDICYDGRGTIWIASFRNGIYAYDIVQGKWHRYKLDGSDDAICLLCDSAGRIWGGAKGKQSGIYLYDKSSDCFSPIFNKANGLPNDVIYKLLEDKLGKIWGSTNKGLFCIDTGSSLIHSYTSKQGLLGDQFNYKSGLRASDGKLYFGGIKGFVAFYPDNIKTHAPAARLVFNSLQINNTIIDPSKDKKSILKQSISYTDKLELPYTHSSFSISFADLDYSSHAHSYAYMLKGLDNEWISCPNPQSISYSSLKPGRYSLIVSSLDDKLMPNKQSITLDIRILAPFYLSIYAFIIYALLLALVTYLGVNLWTRNETRRREDMHKEIEAAKEKELYNAKLSFFTNIAHEIRTPLSLIKLPLDEVLKQKGLKGESFENLKIMKHNTDRILKLVGELLDFRKAETEGIKISPMQLNIVEPIKETIARFRPAAEVRDVVIGLHAPEIIMADVDRELFIKILSNLVNNALKHSKSFISIDVNSNAQHFTVSVTNDGDIIPLEYADKIFNPYFKIDENSQGSGIGLPFAQMLAQMHHGNISLDKIHSKNTCFIVELPLRQEHSFDLSPAEDTKESILEQEEARIEEQLNPVDKTTILLAEDNDEFSRFLSKQLFSDYNVLRAANGQQALELLYEHKGQIDMLITDLMMPIMDGTELSRKIREDLRFSHIPIIILTAKTNIQTKMECLEIGIDDYIEKPFSAEFLKARIENLIASRKSIANSYNNSPEASLNAITHSNADNHFIASVVKIINEHIEETDLNVDMIAQELNMSRATFYRKVKSISQLTPNDFIRLTRLKRAAELLKNGEYRVNEIAYIVGFSSSSYFSKCFYKQFGVLPRNYVSGSSSSKD